MKIIKKDPNPNKLQGWNNYHCSFCLNFFKSHYEKHACPSCQSTDIEFECYIMKGARTLDNAIERQCP